MVSALLLAAALPRTVTFSHPGAHSSVVLAAFGKEIGETVRPTGSVLRDYFLVRFDQMPVEDAKAAIAKALNATWTVSGGVTYLTRTKQQELVEEQELDEAFRKALERTIEDAQKLESERKPYDARAITELLRQVKPDEYPEFDMPEEPSERLYSRLIASLDVKDLLASPSGTVRYSSRPSGDDKPLPPSWKRAYEKFIEESTVWRDMLGTVFDEEDERRGWFGDYGGRLDEVATFELKIKEREVSLSIGFEWSDGGSSSNRGNIAYAYMFESGLDDLIEGVDAKVKVDEETKEMWRAPDEFGFTYSSFMSTPEKIDPQDIPAPLKRCISDLENNEPLTKLVSWPFLQLAEAKGVNMVVLMPDSVVDWVFTASVGDGTTIQDLFQSWWMPLSARRDEEAGCWYLFPSDRPGERAKRTDRAAFGRMLRAVSQRGWRGVAETAAYISSTKSREVSVGFASLLSLAECEKPEAYTMPEHFGLASQLFASLPLTVWRSTWGEGIELPMEQWPARMREVLMSHDDPEGFMSTHLNPEEMVAAFSNPPDLSATLKRGLPQGTTLHISVSAQDILWVDRGDYRQPSDLESIGWHILSGEEDTESDSKVKTLAPGQRETLKVELRVPGIGTYLLSDGFAYTPFGHEYKTLDKLDPELRKAVQESLKRAREGGGMPPHIGGGVMLRLR